MRSCTVWPPQSRLLLSAPKLRDGLPSSTHPSGQPRTRAMRSEPVGVSPSQDTDRVVTARTERLSVPRGVARREFEAGGGGVGVERVEAVAAVGLKAGDHDAAGR